MITNLAYYCGKIIMIYFNYLLNFLDTRIYPEKINVFLQTYLHTYVHVYTYVHVRAHGARASN